MARTTLRGGNSLTKVCLARTLEWSSSHSPVLAELVLIRDALNVGPEDQSLWYYHQFLMLNLTEHADRPTIAGQLTVEERVAYLKQEIADIKELSEDYDDCKLIYENLMEYTVALSALEGRQPSSDEKAQLESWLSTLRKLDPMRHGRWEDVEKGLAPARP